MTWPAFKVPSTFSSLHLPWSSSSNTFLSPAIVRYCSTSCTLSKHCPCKWFWELAGPLTVKFYGSKWTRNRAKSRSCESLQITRQGPFPVSFAWVSHSSFVNCLSALPWLSTNISKFFVEAGHAGRPITTRCPMHKRPWSEMPFFDFHDFPHLDFVYPNLSPCPPCLFFIVFSNFSQPFSKFSNCKRNSLGFCGPMLCRQTHWCTNAETTGDRTVWPFFFLMAGRRPLNFHGLSGAIYTLRPRRRRRLDWFLFMLSNSYGSCCNRKRKSKSVARGWFVIPPRPAPAHHWRSIKSMLQVQEKIKQHGIKFMLQAREKIKQQRSIKFMLQAQEKIEQRSIKFTSRVHEKIKQRSIKFMLQLQEKIKKRSTRLVCYYPTPHHPIIDVASSSRCKRKRKSNSVASSSCCKCKWKSISVASSPCCKCERKQRSIKFMLQMQEKIKKRSMRLVCYYPTPPHLNPWARSINTKNI